jgi:hypothetical protein
LANNVATTTDTNQSNSNFNIGQTLQHLYSLKQQAEAAGPGTDAFNQAHNQAMADYNALKQAGLDPNQFSSMNAQQLQSYIATNPTKVPLPASLKPNTTGNVTEAFQGNSMYDASGNLVGFDTRNGQTAYNTMQAGGQTLSLPVYQGHTVAPAGEIAKDLGVNYTVDQKTGQVTVNGKVINPVGVDASGTKIVNVRDFLHALGVTDDQIQWDPKTNQITYSMPQKPPESQYQSPMQGIMSSMPQGYQSPMQGIMSSMPQMPQLQPYQPPDLSQFYNNLQPLQPFNPDWNTYYQQAASQINPLTDNSISTLLNKQQMDITQADEGLNAKGIFNSGIAVQVENQIRANTNDQIAKVIMNANAQIAKVAQQLYTDAINQWYKGNSLAMQNNKLWLDMAMQQAKQSFDQWLQTQKLSMDQYSYALKAWDDVSQMALKDAQFQATDAFKRWDSLSQMALKDAQFQAQQGLDYAKLNQQIQYQNQDLALKQEDLGLKLGQMMGSYNGLPTLQAQQDAFDRAWRMSQMFGYLVDENGKPILDDKGNRITTLDAQKLAETIRHNQQSELLKLEDMMGFDQNGTPTLQRDVLMEKMINDMNTAENTAYGHELSAIQDYIKNIMERHTDPITKAVKIDPSDPDYKTLEDLLNRENTIMKQTGNFTDKGYADWGKF